MVNTLELVTDLRHLGDKIESLGYAKLFIRGVKQAGFWEMLNGNRIFTVFVPNDGAFYTMPQVLVDDLFRDTERLSQIIRYHIVPDILVTTSDILSSTTKGMQQYGTLDVDPLLLNHENGPMVNNTQITEADIRCGNGIIHIINNVLRPLP